MIWVKRSAHSTAEAEDPAWPQDHGKLVHLLVAVLDVYREIG